MMTAIVMALVLAVPTGMAYGAQPDGGTVQPMGSKGDGCNRTPGTWFLGEAPANPDPSKPPIVFVQGLNGCSDSWYGETQYYGVNDMAAYARNNGYRTVFVELNDSGGSAANQWDNGRMLADLLRQIHGTFGQRVNVVAHSKGGIDTQTALVHYGAHPYVGRVVTLGSPHYGSHLADLAYSSWAGWLAALLGARSAGTESLQVANMQQFRNVTDSHPNVNQNSYFTAAGTSWGPTFSALWTGGAYLSSYGSNDGLVNVWSTSLPNGNHLFTTNLDHDNIRLGRTVFSRIEPTLRGTAMASQPMMAEVAATAESIPNRGDNWVRGGPLATGEKVEWKVTVTEETEEAIFSLMTASENVKVELTSPSGKTYNRQSEAYGSSKETEIFQDAVVQAFRIDQPEAGTWTVRLESQQKDAYLLTGTFLGSQMVTLDMEESKSQKAGQAIPVEVKLAHAKLKAKDLSVDVKVTPPASAKKMKSASQQGRLKADSKANAFKGSLPQLTEPGVYNVTVDVKGTDAQGRPFERTIIRSIYVEGGKQER
jgi:triacylglycerol esterase/lipase EstA (alpha/beta hydrolase family)